MTYLIISIINLFLTVPGYGTSTSGDIQTGPLNGYIHDQAKILSDRDQFDLEALARNIESDAHTQIMVLTTNNVDNLSIEKFSLQTATEWKIGKGVDGNGVLIVIIPDQHKTRIEVSKTLAGILPNNFTKDIQVNTFRPNFRNGNYYAGIKEAMNLIKSRIEEHNQGNTPEQPIAAKDSIPNYTAGVRGDNESKAGSISPYEYVHDLSNILSLEQVRSLEENSNQLFQSSSFKVYTVICDYNPGSISDD